MTARTITLKDGRVVEVEFGPRFRKDRPYFVVAWGNGAPPEPIETATGPTEADAIAALKRKLEGEG